MSEERIHERKPVTAFIIKYLKLTLGAVIYAAGIAMFLDPNRLAPGGVSGIAIIIHELFGVLPTGTLILLINIPIIIIGWIRFGFGFMFSTLYTIIVSSFAINVFLEKIGALTEDPLLACAAGAVLGGVGIGVVFRAGATTGGSDIIVKIFRRKFRYLNTGLLFLLVDGMVVAVSGAAFGDINLALYAGISLLIQMTVINAVLYGGDEARMVYIISSRKDVIAGRIMKELDAGATFLSGRGAYTGNSEEVLLVVLRMRSLPEARDIVVEEDRHAFMIVTSATSVFGEGFKPFDSAEL
ncbi:MAG: YitT family protein [Clostridia bacterium]|nr:YitT family protein [Clostridia bacterium]